MFNNKHYEKGYNDAHSKFEAKISDLNTRIFDLSLRVKHYEASYGNISYENILNKSRELEKEKTIFEAEKSISKIKTDLDISKKEIELMKKYQEKLESIIKKQIGCEK